MTTTIHRTDTTEPSGSPAGGRPAGVADTELLRPDWLTADDWPYPVRSLPVGDHTIAYTDTGGDRPVLLLVHAGMWSFVWRDLLARLSSDFRCVTFDAPGNGPSLGPGRVGLSDAAEVTTALVDDLELTDLTLVLHDLGGPAALHAAADWTERVSAVAAVNTFGWRPAGVAFRSMLAVMGNGAMRELDVWTGLIPRMTSTRFGVGRHLDRRDRRLFRRGMDHRGRRAFHHYLRSARSQDLARVDHAIELLADRPLVTVFGEHNDPLGFQPLWADRFADCEQVVIPGGNHFPMADDPDAVAAAIRRLHQRATASASVTGSR